MQRVPEVLGLDHTRRPCYSCTVHDGLGATAAASIPSPVADRQPRTRPLSAFAAVAAEYSDVVTGVTQPRDDEPPQRARATR